MPTDAAATDDDDDGAHPSSLDPTTSIFESGGWGLGEGMEDGLSILLAHFFVRNKKKQLIISFGGKKKQQHTMRIGSQPRQRSHFGAR